MMKTVQPRIDKVVAGLEFAVAETQDSTVRSVVPKLAAILVADIPNRVR